MQAAVLDRVPVVPPYPPPGALGAWGWVWEHVHVEFLEARAHAGEAGWHLEPRTVPNALAALVLQGRTVWRIADRSVVAGPGDLLLVPEGVPHAAEPSASPVRLLSVHFTARVLGAQCLLLLLGFPPVAKDRAYADAVHELVRLAVHSPPGWRPRGRALVLELLLRIAHERPGEFRPLQAQEVRALQLLCSALQVLETTHGRVSVAELARVAACSPTHLRRLFRLGLGMSPSRYLLERRLQRAADLLRSTDDTVQQVAERCGFESLSHFHRHFKARYGCTPLAFRARRGQPP